MQEQKLMTQVTVAGTFAGEAVMRLYEVEVTQDGYRSAEHLDLARKAAEADSLDGPFLCFPEETADQVVAVARQIEPGRVVVRMEHGEITSIESDTHPEMLVALIEEEPGKDPNPAYHYQIESSGKLKDVTCMMERAGRLTLEVDEVFLGEGRRMPRVNLSELGATEADQPRSVAVMGFG